ncbi:MAG: transcriptional repressor LexA [Bacillota bacterium]
MGRKKNIDISEKQQQILNFIIEEKQTIGIVPSIREICDACKLSSTATVHTHLAKLKQFGYLKFENGKKRSLQLSNELSETFERTVLVPLVGNVTAGQPITAVENIEEQFRLPIGLIGKESDLFMLKIQGDSMVNAGIIDGDLIIVQKSQSANNGDIVVALVNDDEATVKRFYRESNRVRLQPENDHMPAMYFETISLIGKVVGLYRSI